MADNVVDIILELGPAHLQLFNFLVGGEINLLLDAIDFVIEPVVFIEQAAEVVVGAFQAPDDLTMLGELSQDRMMKVHGDGFLLWLTDMIWGRRLKKRGRS